MRITPENYYDLIMDKNDANCIEMYIIIDINYLSNRRKRVVYYDYYFFQELKLTTPPLREPMLHFHMATSALSNLGGQGRNLPKHQMLGARVIKRTAMRWMKKRRKSIHLNYSPVQTWVAFMFINVMAQW